MYPRPHLHRSSHQIFWQGIFTFHCSTESPSQVCMELYGEIRIPVQSSSYGQSLTNRSMVLPNLHWLAGFGPLNSHMFFFFASKLTSLTSTRHPSTCPTLIPLYCAVITGTTNLRATWCNQIWRDWGVGCFYSTSQKILGWLPWLVSL